MNFNDIGRELYATYRMLAEAEAEERLTKLSIDALEDAIAANVLLSTDYKNAEQRKAAVTVACNANGDLTALRAKYADALSAKLRLRGEIDANEALRRGKEYTLLAQHEAERTGDGALNKMTSALEQDTAEPDPLDDLLDHVEKFAAGPVWQGRSPVIQQHGHYDYLTEQWVEDDGA